MAVRNRNVAVLFSLIASMTIGALVLMALDNDRPIRGAFSLSSFLRLDPVEDAVKKTLAVPLADWDQIEIYYSYTSGGNANELALLTDLTTGTKTQFHFVVGNGTDAPDGAVQAGTFWKQQKLCQGRDGVVRICVISDGQSGSVTDCQINRTNALAESLLRTCGLAVRNIRYPANWQM